MLPVSDDGGSTAEIVRVLGGPAVGDIRSRCLRLADASNVEVEQMLHVLALCTVVRRDLHFPADLITTPLVKLAHAICHYNSKDGFNLSYLHRTPRR